MFGGTLASVNGDLLLADTQGSGSSGGIIYRYTAAGTLVDQYSLGGTNDAFGFENFNHACGTGIPEAKLALQQRRADFFKCRYIRKNFVVPFVFDVLIVKAKIRRQAFTVVRSAIDCS